MKPRLRMESTLGRSLGERFSREAIKFLGVGEDRRSKGKMGAEKVGEGEGEARGKWQLIG